MAVNARCLTLSVVAMPTAQTNAVRTEFVWDPTEPIATRPLAMRAKNWGLNLFYSHDGNKNVSEVFYHAPQNGIAAHYDYAPFGAVTRTSSATRVTNRDLLSENPFRFSSEYHDDPLSLVYYNYRHYNPLAGRWLGRDWVEVLDSPYGFVSNRPLNDFDCVGLRSFLDWILGEDEPPNSGIRDSESTNCLGYALTGVPNADFISPRPTESLNDVLVAYGWEGSDRPLACDCDTAAIIKLYVYVDVKVNNDGSPSQLEHYETIKQIYLERTKRKPFSSPYPYQTNDEKKNVGCYDFHAIRQDCDSRTGKGLGWETWPGAIRKGALKEAWPLPDEYFFMEDKTSQDYLPLPGHHSVAQIIAIRYYRKPR